MSERRYLSCADTAKMIRQVLKESFLGQKFSVKSHTYSGGASIDVSWIDGPSAGTVDGLVKIFERSYFDGMIDYKGSKYHTLDGQEIRFGADFVFTKRALSKAVAEAKVAYFADKYGRSDWVLLEGNEAWGYRVQIAPSAPSLQLDLEAYDKQHTAKAQESATFARIKFTGDDGYGAGTVGPDGSGAETAQGYPRAKS